MPRYHYNIYDGRSTLDAVGTELPDLTAARREAIRTAGRILDDEAQREALGADWCMEVTDAQGLLLFRLDFHVTEAPAVSQGS